MGFVDPDFLRCLGNDFETAPIVFPSEFKIRPSVESNVL